MDTYELETLYNSSHFFESTGYNPDDYTSDFIHFESKDGT